VIAPSTGKLLSIRNAFPLQPVVCPMTRIQLLCTSMLRNVNTVVPTTWLPKSKAQILQAQLQRRTPSYLFYLSFFLRPLSMHGSSNSVSIVRCAVPPKSTCVGEDRPSCTTVGALKLRTLVDRAALLQKFCLLRSAILRLTLCCGDARSLHLFNINRELDCISGSLGA